MLKLQFRDRRQEAIWLVDPLFTVGSSPTNSLVINEAGISSVHIEIRTENNQTTILNKDPAVACYINDEKVLSEKVLTAGDVIKLGNIQLDVIDPHSTQYQSAIGLKPGKPPEWRLKSTASWMENEVFTIDKKASLGRDANCDISIPVEHLSRRHAEVEVKGGKLLVRDLDSSNGTYLNGNKITESYAKSGDKIKLDVITFEVIGPSEDPNKTIIRSVSTANKSAAPKRQTKQQPKDAKHNKISPKPVIQKRSLASNGKQPWIEESGSTKKNHHYWWFAVAGFAITLLATIFLLR